MIDTSEFEPSTRFWPETHRVENQPQPLENYNAWLSDPALQAAVRAHGGDWASSHLERLGARTGSAEVIEWGFQANANKPVLHTHNRHGQRVDEISYHPAYHQLMELSLAEGIHASHWQTPGPGAQVARAARFYLVSQVEAGHGCPVTMTSAAIPALRHQPDVYQQWSDKILASRYDPSNRPHTEKDSVTIGMAMTEKQGGSDVQQNSTRAYPLAATGPGQAYELVGHKYFVSAPMCDAFLVLARTDIGVCCFLVPRWRPDGSKNPLQIQQLKNKMGNASNASSETELRGALGWMVGEEGRGVATIIEMVSMTRFDCMLGSAAGMRQAVVQAVHHCRQREVFGQRLSQQPLMQNVLLDLIVEQEAALALSLRMAQALDRREQDESEKLLARLGLAVGKYWICKRVAGHASEAMECIGGMGLMEDCIMPRLYREAPVNAIWEGSGNVQCLDVLRAMQKSPAAVEVYLAEVERGRGLHPSMDRAIAVLKQCLADGDGLEYRSRGLVVQMALTLQAACLLQYGNPVVADAFCRSRLGVDSDGWLYGSLPRIEGGEGLIERSLVI